MIGAQSFHNVMPGHSRPKDGVASLAYVPGIHASPHARMRMDGRDEPGHDEAAKATYLTKAS
ncbi:hypothetical protein AYJ54_40440 [Bradyrhizobium centrolobii]|uniref:Uncharacterized protein n=1 Tax=Bradyrhizobium centrolobii TaxID=1505087 RepID=A0A176Z6F1_9BRAD|nr:hypothetical protein AYJ54_40440 [Bradyrhizobium centrolobii]